jgi:predicted RNase H-like nuclease (RuvC/YqgF family)
LEWTIILPLLGVLIGPVIAYVVAARRMSGKIATSDASDLWEESASIREDYRTRLLQANERALSVEIRMAALEARNLGLERENYELKTKVITLEATITRLETTITKLEARLEGP